MYSVDTDGFIDSKRTICEDYKQEKHNLKAFTAKTKCQMDALAPPGKVGRGTRKYRKKEALFDRMDALLKVKEEDKNRPTYTHRALIKLAVWPVIRRYSPGSVEEQNVPGKPLSDKDGFRIVLIGKGGVVAYYGRDQKKVEDYSTLKEWVSIKEKQKKGRWIDRDIMGTLTCPMTKVVTHAVGVAAIAVAVVLTDGYMGSRGLEKMGGVVTGWAV